VPVADESPSRRVVGIAVELDHEPPVYPDQIDLGARAAHRIDEPVADQLRAAIAMNPLLKSIGEPLDPKTLFEGPSGKTRVSVINLAGLASLTNATSLRSFVAAVRYERKLADDNVRPIIFSPMPMKAFFLCCPYLIHAPPRVVPNRSGWRPLGSPKLIAERGSA
jgi:hypothetical protein